MALDSDLQSFKPLEISDVGTNGGYMSDEVFTTGLPQNVFRNALKAERTIGSTTHRKLSDKLNDDSNDPLSGAQILLDLPTPGEDWIIQFMTTPSSTQADIVGTERKYGNAYLKNNIVAGTSTLTVTVKDVTLTTGNDQIFFDTDTIRITTKPNPDSGTGLVEDVVINGVPSVSGLDITIVSATPFLNSYLVADGGRVSSVYNVTTDIKASVGTVVVTSTSGTFDDTTYPPTVHNQATIDTDITLTFTDASNYGVTSPRIAGMGSGDITTNYSFENPAWTNDYIEIDYQAFGGTYVAGDTIVIPTVSAAVHRFEKRVIPPLSGSLANNKTVSAWNGESVT